MRVLVTGGSGYVGRAVCQRLQAQHEVLNFDLHPGDAPCARFIRGDILNTAHLMEAMRGVDAVVHLAAIPNPAHDPSDTIMQVNVMGTQRVVEAAALGSPRRIVVASSDATFGFVFGQGAIVPQYLPVDETHPTRPRDCYGLSKVIKEEICRRYTRDSGLETVCLRYCWVWNPDHYHSLQDLASRPENFAGQLWGYVDVRDVAQAVEKALIAPGLTHETLLISAHRTFQQVPSLELASRYFSPQPTLRIPDWFSEEPCRTLFDCTRARDTIGFVPQYDCWEEAAKLQHEQ